MQFNQIAAVNPNPMGVQQILHHIPETGIADANNIQKYQRMNIIDGDYDFVSIDFIFKHL